MRCTAYRWAHFLTYFASLRNRHLVFGNELQVTLHFEDSVWAFETNENYKVAHTAHVAHGDMLMPYFVSNYFVLLFSAVVLPHFVSDYQTAREKFVHAVLYLS